MSDLFYLQDTRAYVGNSILLWRKECQGYTVDPTQAHVFTREAAFRQHASRSTDIPWPKDYIDQRATLHVDSQRLDRDEVLRGEGEEGNDGKD